MDAPNFVTVKRGRSTSISDSDITKIKRSETPDDIMSAFLKEKMLGKADAAEDTSETEVRENEREKGRGEKQKPRLHVSHGCHLVQGKMRHGMEDYVVATHKKIDGHELGLFAVFDGHSGRKVAEYLQNCLFDNILNEHDFWTNPTAAIVRAYEDTDRDILENVVGPTGGSTAVTAILIDGEKLVVANVGDSRAVLSRNGEAKQVSVDHEPLREKKMVESKGGFVSRKPGNVPRVDGQLSMTRAFGDERLKRHITSKPDIAIEMIFDATECIILASDGVWHVNLISFN